MTIRFFLHLGGTGLEIGIKQSCFLIIEEKSHFLMTSQIDIWNNYPLTLYYNMKQAQRVSTKLNC